MGWGSRVFNSVLRGPGPWVVGVSSRCPGRGFVGPCGRPGPDARHPREHVRGDSFGGQKPRPGVRGQRARGGARARAESASRGAHGGESASNPVPAGRRRRACSGLSRVERGARVHVMACVRKEGPDLLKLCRSRLPDEPRRPPVDFGSPVCRLRPRRGEARRREARMGGALGLSGLRTSAGRRHQNRPPIWIHDGDLPFAGGTISPSSPPRHPSSGAARRRRGPHPSLSTGPRAARRPRATRPRDLAHADTRRPVDRLRCPCPPRRAEPAPSGLV